MTAYTTAFSGNVQIGTGDNINPPDEGNIVVQQSIPIVNVAGTGSTFFRIPANCRISEIWFDLAAAGVATTAGTQALYYSADGIAYANIYSSGNVFNTFTRFTYGAPAGTPFSISLNTGANTFWRFDVAGVVPATATGLLSIRYHLLTP